MKIVPTTLLIALIATQIAAETSLTEPLEVVTADDEPVIEVDTPIDDEPLRLDASEICNAYGMNQIGASLIPKHKTRRVLFRSDTYRDPALPNQRFLFTVCNYQDDRKGVRRVGYNTIVPNIGAVFYDDIIEARFNCRSFTSTGDVVATFENDTGFARYMSLCYSMEFIPE